MRQAEGENIGRDFFVRLGELEASVERLKALAPTIVQAYRERKDVEKFAHLASYAEIQENDYNLNIPRYVDTFEEEPPVDLGAAFAELANIGKEEKELDATLNGYFEELGLTWRL